jgi:glycosyltransferase involved in cell wall biosynthesis
MICVWVNKRDWRSPGPIVNVGLRNAYHLAVAGLETHFFVGAGPDSDTDADLRDFYRLEPTSRLQVHRISRRTAVPMRGKRYPQTTSRGIFTTAAQTVSHLATTVPAPVTVLTREPSFLPRLALLRHRFPRKVRAFYEAHDLYADLAWKKRERLPVKSADRRQQFLECLFLPRIDGLIGITPEQTALYRNIFPKLHCFYLPIGTELGPVVSTDELERRRSLRQIVYVGRLTRTKGLTWLLAVAGRLRERGVKVAFWGGNERQGEQVRSMAKEFGPGDNVTTVSTRSPEALGRALAAEASIAVLPLEDDFYNRNLTCPAKGLDYLAHSLPVVASDLPSTRALFGNGGAAEYVIPGDIDNMARTCLALLEDTKLYSAVSTASQQRAREVSWATRVGKLLEMIRIEEREVKPAKF